MARNVTVAWVLPTTRDSGRPLNPADIAGVDLSISVDGTTWSPYDTFLPAVTTTVVPELDIGEWFFSGVVRDTNGRTSTPVVSSIVIPDETAPGPLVLTLSL